MKKYLVTINGHGVETAFLRLTPEQYSFWEEQNNDEDFEITDYIFSPEDFEDVIPDEMNILFEDGEAYNWDYNPLIEFVSSTPNFDNCDVCIEEISDDDSKEILNTSFIEFNDEYECLESSEHVKGSDQMMEINSYEKGTVFGGYFETDNFDPSKLKIQTIEAPNGEDYLKSVTYNGEEIINTESSTRGKGMTVDLWENNFSH